MREEHLEKTHKERERVAVVHLLGEDKVRERVREREKVQMMFSRR